MSQEKIGLDNPAFNGRFKQFGRGSYMPTKPTAVARQFISDIQEAKINPVASAPVKPPVKRLSQSQVIQRNITTKPVASKQGNRVLTMPRVITAMAVIVFMAGLGVTFMGFRTNKNVEAQFQAVISQGDIEIPTEEKPSDHELASYQVAPDMPRTINIDKLGVKSRIINMGMDSKGALMAPGNVYDTGWYNQSSKPGQAGAMLIDGHVHGPTTEGAFFGLKTLAIGDIIEVERGDGKTFKYEVVSSAVTPTEETDMAKAMLPIEEGKPGLNLITCTGELNSTNNDYPERLVIYASQI